MFTGIVEEVGSIVSRSPRGQGARLVVACSWADLALGESIAVAGVCLTVDRIVQGRGFEADASAETLLRSTLANARAGARVNLERAVRPTSRLGGHLMGGHVDGTSRVIARSALGDATALRFELPRDLARFVAEKGSVAIDGVSLTVNLVHPDAFDCVVIPHTLRATTLVDLVVGARINLEVDVLARYVARQLETTGHAHANVTASGGPDTERDESILRAMRDAGWAGTRGH